MSEGPNPKRYDLEDRTFLFAKRVRLFIKTLPRNIANVEDARQLVRASGSVGANYIEANEAVSRKDFLYRIRVCRKESKESRFFSRLVDTGQSDEVEREREWLVQESTEFIKIFSAILRESD